MNSFHPKVILITGCSSGFGLLMSARLSSKGHHVIATMRHPSKKEALLAEVKRRGGDVMVLPLDVRDKTTIQAAVREIGDRYGHLDVLINNAGYGTGGFFEDLTEEEIRAQFETNFFGVQNVTREVIPLMRTRRSGKIINISSIAGLYSSPAFSAYDASKWALEGFSESLYYELKFFGIDVILVEPGTYKTKIFFENAKYAKNYNNPESPYYALSQFMEKRMRSHIEDCHKDPEDVAKLVEKLVEMSNPPFRNIPDFQSRYLYRLRKFLPFKLYAYLLQKGIFHGFKSNSKKAEG